MGLGTSIVLIAQDLARRAVAMQTPHPLPCSRASASAIGTIDDAHDRHYMVAPHLGGAAVAGWMRAGHAPAFASAPVTTRCGFVDWEGAGQSRSRGQGI
jgi:hypothetical protein